MHQQLDVVRARLDLIGRGARIEIDRADCGRAVAEVRNARSDSGVLAADAARWPTRPVEPTLYAFRHAESPTGPGFDSE